MKTTHYCVNIRTAGAGRAMRMCSLLTVCSCTDFSGDEAQSAVIVENCMSVARPPVRTENFKSRKRVQHPGDHKDNDQLIALKTALPESIAWLPICIKKRQAKN